MDISFIITAGGMSRRFGSDKTVALLKNKPLIEWVVDGVLPYGKTLVVAKNLEKYQFLASKGVELVQDRYKQQCALVGLLTGLEHCSSKYIFFISADMPTFPFASMPYMFDKIGKDLDAIIPKINIYNNKTKSVEEKIYPCAGIYSRGIYSTAEAMFTNGDYKLVNLLAKLNLLYLGDDFFANWDPHQIGFMNINTEEDLTALASKVSTQL